jgi:formate-dependent nitrite reductase membrane component NrfD
MLGVALFTDGVAMMSSLRTMALEAAGLVVLEVLAILFFLQAAFKLPDPRESAERILRRRSFVLGYFVLGLAAPLTLMLVLYVSMEQAGVGNTVAVTAIGAVLGLVGGLILRQAVLVCGALPTLNIGGFEFRRIARPKEPKAEMGLLPPQ